MTIAIPILVNYKILGLREQGIGMEGIKIQKDNCTSRFVRNAIAQFLKYILCSDLLWQFEELC